MKKMYSHLEFAKLLGVSRLTVDRRVRTGDIKSNGKKPSKIPHSELERVRGQQVVKPDVRLEWNTDELFRKDIEKADGEEIARVKAMADAIKALEQAKKLKLEHGELYKRTSVEESKRNWGNLVRVKASRIFDGIAGMVKDKSPAEVEAVVERRVIEYLEDLGDSPWDVTELV